MDNDLIFPILAILLLLLLSALFSGSETALTAASRARMHQLARRGNKRAERVNRLTDSMDRLIGGILLGNNLVNILASSLATSVLISVFGKAGVAYATAIMTLLVLVFAEVLPKTYAINRPERTALAVAPVITLVIRLLSPVVHLIQLIVRGVMRVFGVRLDDTGHIISSHEEIRGTLDLHRAQGGMIKADKDMLDSILDLPSVDVFEIMIHRRNMAIIDANLPPADIIREMIKSTYTRVPLYDQDEDNIVGILHAKDLLPALVAAGTPDNVDIRELLRDPWFVPETTTLAEQLEAFRERREHFALVVDEYGALMGLVTLEDILEEIVGDIADEHDAIRAHPIRREPSGAVVVDGTMTIRDLNRELEWSLPEDDAATVAGLLIHEAKRIPDLAERFEFHGHTFEVLRRQRNHITSLRITPTQGT
jgi:Mg2+/Co2+ transporter CorB